MLARRIANMEENGPPPTTAAVLYPGEVMHARLNPFGHRFVYRVFSLLIDLDRVEEAGRLSPLFGTNRARPVSYRDSDQSDREGETARQFADRLLHEAGMARRPARVLLLCYPRIFGYVFNPLSVYFAYDEAGDLIAMIYAVRNTFGQRHTYVAPIERGDVTPAGVRQTRTKIFHVSPFIEMGARYHFRIMPPGNSVRLRIHETQNGTPLLSATFVGFQSELNSRTLAKWLLKIPFMTWKIMAGIHWEALKLWLKGARFHRSPPAPRPASFRDEGAALDPGE